MSFAAYTSIVGANGAGKSTVFAALDLLLGPQTRGRVTKDDYAQRITTDPIVITASFHELSPAEAESLKHYVRQGQLVVALEVEWNVETETPTSSECGIRHVVADFTPYFKASEAGESAAQLKEIYKTIREKYEDLPKATTKAGMEQRLREYEESHPQLCTPIKSKHQFYGASGIHGVLTRHFTWVHVPAIKDAAEEQVESKGGWLNQLVQRVIHSKVDLETPIADLRARLVADYNKLALNNKHHLEDISKSLTERIQNWATPSSEIGLKWIDGAEEIPTIHPPRIQITATDGTFSGAVASHGHGFQRSYLVSLLQELASLPGSNSTSSPSLLLGIEEPELFQHPPHARHLAGVLQDLSKQNQVLVCTHSPLFVSGDDFQSIRLMRRTSGGTTSIAESTPESVKIILDKAGAPPLKYSIEGTRIRLSQILNPVSGELFFCTFAVLVEGPEDRAYILSQLHLRGLHARFRRQGGHVIPAHSKSSMIQLAAVAQSLGIPHFAVFDADSSNKNWETHHRQDNSILLALSGHATESPRSTAVTRKPNLTMWPENIGQSIRADFDNSIWSTTKNRIASDLGLTDGGFEKNELYIGLLMDGLGAAGSHSKTLDNLCNDILAFAEQQKQHFENEVQPAHSEQLNLY